MFPNLTVELRIAGYSQKFLAKHLGLTTKTVGRKLRGEKDFKLGEMRKIQELFPHRTLDYLFTQVFYNHE